MVEPINGWGLVEGDPMSDGMPLKGIVEVQSLLPCLLHFLFTMMCVAVHTDCCPLWCSSSAQVPKQGSIAWSHGSQWSFPCFISFRHYKLFILYTFHSHCCCTLSRSLCVPFYRRHWWISPHWPPLPFMKQCRGICYKEGSMRMEVCRGPLAEVYP